MRWTSEGTAYWAADILEKDLNWFEAKMKGSEVLDGLEVWKDIGAVSKSLAERRFEARAAPPLVNKCFPIIFIIFK